MKIAIIGANEYQNRLIEKCKERKIETHVFAWKDGAIGERNADYFYDISITEKELILKMCEKIGIDGIVSIGSDLAMITVNYIANKLSLIGNSEECTNLTTNKYYMREKFFECKIKCPKFIKISSIEDINLIDKLKFPMIIKPTDRSGSRGVFRVNDMNEVIKAFDISIQHSFSNEVIIEEYIFGKEYSIEFISDNGEHKFLAITEKITSGQPNFIERAHIQHNIYSNSLIDKIIKVCKKSLDALEVKNGASHIELKIFKDEIYIIEIGARMGGDFIGSDLVKLSTGIDFTELVMQKSLGKKIKINKANKDIAFIYFIFDEDDKNKVLFNIKKFNKYIFDIKINKSFMQVQDSSTRNGYVIFNFKNCEYDEFLKLRDLLLQEYY